MTRRVLFVSSSRADLGGLSSVWKEAENNAELDVEILLTGRHVLRQADFDAAEHVIPSGLPVHVCGSDLGGTDGVSAGIAIGRSTAELTPLLARIAPDILVVLGDRLDMVPAVLAAVPLNIPVGHIHGGELTFGAVDDRLRHAVTKLAHLHFTSAQDAGERVCQMGEEPWRVHVTGAPGLDSLVAAPAMERASFLAELGLPDAPFILSTFHPETNSEAPLLAFERGMTALQRFGHAVLVTASNADMGGAEINERIHAALPENDWLYFRDSLGLVRYANALRHASLMVGNSSSGVIEAGLFGLPVIDIGRRQDGRARGANVINVEAEVTAIIDAARNRIGQKFEPLEVSIYGDGHAAQRITAALAALPERSRLLNKAFHTDATRHPVEQHCAIA